MTTSLSAVSTPFLFVITFGSLHLNVMVPNEEPNTRYNFPPVCLARSHLSSQEWVWQPILTSAPSLGTMNNGRSSKTRRGVDWFGRRINSTIMNHIYHLLGIFSHIHFQYLDFLHILFKSICITSLWVIFISGDSIDRILFIYLFIFFKSSHNNIKQNIHWLCHLILNNQAIFGM